MTSMNEISLKLEILFLFLAMFFFLPETRSQEIGEREKQKQEEDLERYKPTQRRRAIQATQAAQKRVLCVR